MVLKLMCVRLVPNIARIMVFVQECNFMINALTIQNASLECIVMKVDAVSEKSQSERDVRPMKHVEDKDCAFMKLHYLCMETVLRSSLKVITLLSIHFI